MTEAQIFILAIGGIMSALCVFAYGIGFSRGFASGRAKETTDSDAYLATVRENHDRP